MRVLGILIVVVSLCRPAWAETKIGVVVGGADAIRAQTESAIGAWLAEHTLALAPAPLAKDGVKTLINCLVLSDMHCARNVVEARGTTSNIIGILEEVHGKGETRSVQLSAYWIAKRHDVVSLQRTCDACTDVVLKQTLDAMTADLAHLAPTMTSKLRVTSTPSGLTAIIDNTPVGTTPVDHVVPFGPHSISVSRDGKVVGERRVETAPEIAMEVDVPVRAEPTVPAGGVTKRVVVVEESSRTVPVIMLGVGIAAIATGAVLYVEGKPTGANFTYRDTRPAGIATAAGGGLLAVIGTIWLLRHHSSAPEVAITSRGAMVGWAGSF